MRYYTADKNVTCKNCSRRGHLSKNCPTPKVNATLKLLVAAAVVSSTLLCLPLKALRPWFIITWKGCCRLKDSSHKISLLVVGLAEMELIVPTALAARKVLVTPQSCGCYPTSPSPAGPSGQDPGKRHSRGSSPKLPKGIFLVVWRLLSQKN